MSIFTPILERMAAGQVEPLYAHISIRMDGDKLFFYKNKEQKGSFWVESVNQVPVCGTVVSLHPALTVQETSFQGKTQIHYSYDWNKGPDSMMGTEPGILIQYNGGELVIPFIVMDGEPVTKIQDEIREMEPLREKKPSGSLQVKKRLSAISRLLLDYMVLEELQEDSQSLSDVLDNLSVHVDELVQMDPQNIRYRLYEAILAVKTQEIARARALDQAMRRTVVSARKTYIAEFCLLRYLEYGIAMASQNLPEANEMKKQLFTFLPQALKKNPCDQDIVCLLGSECIRKNMADPMALWDLYKELYESGNNSPFLYLQGLCILQSLMMEMDTEFEVDGFILRCFCAGSKHGILDRELAGRVLKETSFLSAPYLYHLYRNIYEMYPDQEVLAELCRMMIRMDMKGADAYAYYQKGVQAHLRLGKLFDYYMYTLPEGYNQPVDREVLLYYATDSYVNPSIYLKLCRNMIRFYQEDQEICDQYMPHMEAFVRTQLSYHRISADLAELADFVITTDNLDTKLAENMLPLLHYVEIRGNVPDGTKLIYQNGVYQETQTVTFCQNQAVLSMPEGLGRIQLMDAKGNSIGGVGLEITPIIQNDDLVASCEALCGNLESYRIMKHARWLHDQVQGNGTVDEEGCDLQTCLQYMKDARLSSLLKQDALHYVNRSNGITYMLAQGQVRDAMAIWSHIPKEQLRENEVFALATQLMNEDPLGHSELLEPLLIWLLAHDSLDASMLDVMAKHGCRPMDVQIQIYAACKAHGIPHLELSASILERQLLAEEKDWSRLQNMFEELVNHDQYQLLNKAAMSVICHGALFAELQPEINLSAFVQGEIMHAGSADHLSDLVKLAFMKQVQKEPLFSEGLSSVRRQLCQELLEKGYELEFLQREAVKLGLPSYPVITVNLSKEGPFGESMEEMVYHHKELLWVEYQVYGQKEVYVSPANHVYGSLYSAEILVYAGEQISYRVRFGDRCTSWMDMDGWNDPLRNRQGLSNRYGLLQQLSLEQMNGGMQAETMQSYEVLMELIRGFGKIM